jgi:hypothetical protein
MLHFEVGLSQLGEFIGQVTPESLLGQDGLNPDKVLELIGFKAQIAELLTQLKHNMHINPLSPQTFSVDRGLLKAAQDCLGKLDLCNEATRKGLNEALNLFK